MLRVYNRKIPPPLPVHRMISRVTPSLPEVVDLRKFCGPIKDQGQEGSCTGHAATSACEWIHRAYLSNKTVVFSPQYTYIKELIAQGDFPNDVGSDGVTLCKTLIVNGCCELSVFPYVPGQIIKPTPEQDANAAQFTLGAYHGLKGSNVAQSVLGDPVPWPIVMGFNVYESFESDVVANTGVYNPQQGERSLGGHEVMLCGYDIGVTPSLRPANCPPAFLVQNSWGTAWGWESGYFWAAQTVLDAADTDLKIAHAGHPW